MKLAYQKILAELSVTYMEKMIDAIASKEGITKELNIQIKQAELMPQGPQREMAIKEIKLKLQSQDEKMKRIELMYDDMLPKYKYFTNKMGEKFNEKTITIKQFPKPIYLGMLNKEAVRQYIEGNESSEYVSIEDKIAQCESFLYSYPLITSRNDPVKDIDNLVQLELKKESTENSLADLTRKHIIFSEILGQL